MNTKREAFLADFQQLLKKHNIPAHYFYSIDAEGAFGDYSMSQDELAGMVFDILRHEDFADAAEEITKVIAQELRSSKNTTADLSRPDEMKWTWRKKN